MNTYQIILETILEKIIVYFSNPWNVLFWGLLTIFIIVDRIKKYKIKKSWSMKKWLKNHNIGKKY